MKIILRTTDELRKVIAANPLPPETRNPSGLLVAFLGGPIADTAKALLTSLKIPSEELHFGKQELYLYFTEGIANSKLSNALTEKKLGVNVTARNWNIVNALLKMGPLLERFAASGGRARYRPTEAPLAFLEGIGEDPADPAGSLARLRAADERLAVFFEPMFGVRARRPRDAESSVEGVLVAAHAAGESGLGVCRRWLDMPRAVRR